MKHEWRPAPKGEEAKERIPAWLYPSTLETIDKLVKENNCKSRSDFLETAAPILCGLSFRPGGHCLSAARVGGGHARHGAGQ